MVQILREAWAGHTDPYAGGHRFLTWVGGIGPLLLGILLMLAPAYGEYSPQLAAMPIEGVAVWGVGFALGGLGVLLGQSLRPTRPTFAAKAEAAGLVLLAGCLFAAWMSSLLVMPNPLSMIFLACMVIGALHRAVYLIRS